MKNVSPMSASFSTFILPSNSDDNQYKLASTILNNVEDYEGAVSRTKKISPCSVEFEVGEEK